MTPTRRRVRMSKYIILVNHIGTKMGTKFLYLYFIDMKQRGYSRNYGLVCNLGKQMAVSADKA